MILYIAIAVITIALAYLAGAAGRFVPAADITGTRAQLFGRACLAAIFVILFCVSAFRLNVGNDYATYVEFMHRLYTDKYIADPGVPTEWGFNLLTRAVYAISGKESFILVFAIYAFVTIAVFLIAMWEQSKDFVLSFFMFMTLGLYYQSLSTVRYYLALAIALYCMKLVNERRWIMFILLVLIGSGFHKSILLIIPLYLLATIDWKKWQLAVVMVFFVSCLFLQDYYLRILVLLYPSYEGTEYLEGSATSYINIIRCVLVLGLALYCCPDVNDCSIKELLKGKLKGRISPDPVNRFYFYLNLGALALYVFCSFVPVISRIGYYLTVSQLLFVPSLIGGLKDGKKKRIIRTLCVAVCVLYFAIYMRRASSDGILILPYRTFFFNDMVDILSNVG